MGAAEDIGWLKQELGAQLEEVLVEGDQPVLLDDPAYAFLTLAPKHQLFCVGCEDGKPVGRREHVATCPPGQLLLGHAPGTGAGATALLLSGATGSIVWRVPAAGLLALGEVAAGTEIVARFFEGWVRLLVGMLPPAPAPTRYRVIKANERIEAHGDVPLRAGDGMVWIAPAARPRSYLGLEPDGAPAGGYWPLDGQAWAICDAGGLVARTSHELLLGSEGTSFRHGFHSFVVGVVSRRRAELEQERVAGDQASRQAERRFVSESLEQLAAVGGARRLPVDRTAQVGSGDAFAEACLAIARWLEIDPPRMVTPRGSSLSHMQAALSRIIGVRTRSVLLEGEWWIDDAGALLGFLPGEEEELHPVALLPAAGGYELFDPRDGSRRRVDAALAETLHPQAHQFYAPLPARKTLRPLDVLRFSARRARRDIAFVGAVGLLAGSVGMAVPLLTGLVFDRIIPGAERRLLVELTLVLFSVFVGQALFDLARSFALVRAQTRMDATLEAAIWDRLLSLPLPFFRKYSAGDLAARAAGIGGIRDVLAGATLSVMLSAVFSAWNLGYLFYVDSGLAVVACGLVAVAGVVAGIAARAGLRRQRSVAEIDGRIGGLLLQVLSGIAKLRVTGAENRAFSVWARLFARRRDADVGAEWVHVRVAVFQTAFPLLCNLVLFWMMASRSEGRLSTGQFLAFSTAFTVFLAAMLNLIATGLQSLVVIPLYERAKPVLTHPLEHHGTTERRTVLGGEIEVGHVSFRYDPAGPLVLDDVSLTIGKNEFVALVGPSGSGKSTLLRILLGFETPTEGGVFFDRQPLASLDVRVVRQQIGVVTQNSRVMAGDIFHNIVGNTGLGIDDAWRAARQAALDKDVEAMPMGMHTVISQGGGTFSGGQRQRLLIARALVSQPRILFFDEATSALDNVTQAVVSESLDALQVTRVVIAHRLSTIRHADRIVVLERGRVVQVGTFEELMKADGPFRALAARQTV
ncbi:MAG: NHLP bacteriocin export ABC transporter permease/ATPase subunit [Deltaproteobacteria bacterium]|nr:NHLP bacteriocin export ABC transporter permease/ATPase subunit [Deltaproteobacteria bacterium]